ncbi:hypothetical protein ACA910_012617 [Epithemia clementina (nom. ined.)]
MKLLGIAIIGKSNEPLYLCDCEKVDQFVHNSGGDASETTKEEADASQLAEDYFGFGLTSRTVSTKNQGQSLSMEHQLLLHASLDPLEEMIGASKLDGTMPLRRNSNYSAWLGLLTTLDGTWAVYGHVSATNIKFLALCELNTAPSTTMAPKASSPWADMISRTTSSTSSLLSGPEQKVKKLLSTIHKHYVDYIMNPFSKPTEPILHSVKFDREIRQSIAQYNDRENHEIGSGGVPVSSPSFRQ